MEPNQTSSPRGRSNAADFFLNLGATVALYVGVGSLISLLFTVIDHAYPKISDYYYYGTSGSSSISWSVATLVIFTPILIILMWVLGRAYETDPERKNRGIHKWLTYLTLFVSGALISGDLITVVYYFIDGQDLTAGFLLKVSALLVVSGSVFAYFVSDIRDRLNAKSRRMWRIFAVVVVLGSIILGFSVLGSPQTQRLYKYDDQKVQDLMNIDSSIQNFYSINAKLPKDFVELSAQSYYVNVNDAQLNKPYEYTVKTATTYELCAEFNKDTNENLATSNRSTVMYPYYGETNWTHPAGRYCFEQKINPNLYPTKALI